MQTWHIPADLKRPRRTLWAPAVAGVLLVLVAASGPAAAAGPGEKVYREMVEKDQLYPTRNGRPTCRK